MKMYRIQAIILRHLLLSFREFGNVINLFFWPSLNIILWGFSSIWSKSVQQQSLQMTIILLTALTLWQVLFRVNMEVCLSLFDEIISNDFTNLFSTPLKLYEWMIAVITLGLLKSAITLSFAIGVIWLLYSINVLDIGWGLAPFIALTIVTGWSVGFLTAAGIVYWGRRVHELVWVVVWAFVPLSGIFYSVKILPQWIQAIAWCIPQSHIFESLRNFIITGKISPSALGICFVISIFYLVLSLIFFKVVFEKSRKEGFSRLER